MQDEENRLSGIVSMYEAKLKEIDERVKELHEKRTICVDVLYNTRRALYDLIKARKDANA